MVAYYLPVLVPNLSGSFSVEIDLAACAFALWRGRRYERFIACVFLTTLTLSFLLSDQLADPHNSLVLWWEGLEFLLLAWLAVRNGAVWLILIAALQLLDLATAVVHRCAPEVAELYAYQSLGIIWDLQLRVVLFLATLAAIQRTKSEGIARFALSGSGLPGRIERLRARLGTGISGWWRTTVS